VCCGGSSPAVALYTAARLVRWLYRRQRAADERLAQAHVDLAARADQQHAWVLAGDDRGVYGAS
jgi:hypothetical protein